MYTIRPRCAGVIGFDGPHPAIAIAKIVAHRTNHSRRRVVMFDLIGWPGIDCTNQMAR
jgi:hypothetical protein